MQLVKIEKKTFSKVEQAKVVLSIFCLLSDIKLSDTELTVLAYFLVYKDSGETRNLILKSEILKSDDSLGNTVSKLKRVGLLKKSAITKEYFVNEKINFQADPVIGVLIKVDNK